MSWTWFYLLVALVLWPVLGIFKQHQRMFEYPAIIAFAFGAFIVPQAISLIRFPGQVQEANVSVTLCMACLCMAAAIFGYRLAPQPRLRHFFSQPADMRRLFHIGVLFVCTGFFFAWKLGNMEVQFSESGGMTGASTIVLFFQGLAYPGFAICLFCTVRHPTLPRLAASIVGAIPLLKVVLIGRRESAAMAALILLVALYYERRWLLTAWLFPIGIFFAALIIPATGTYRMNVEAGAWQAVRQVDLIGNFKRFLTEESTLELRNGAAIIEHTRATGEYEYGAGYWNHLVFRYVPAQILGAEFKNSLRIGTEKQITAGESGLEYEAPTGSTVTGVGDCFQQFGWVGWLFFAFMAVIFRSLWVAAARPEAVFARLLYVLSLTSAMRAVTHWTLDFLPGLLYNLIFLGLAVLYAAAPRQTPRQKQPSRRRGRPVTKATPTAQGNPG